MKIGVITLFQEMFTALDYGITGRTRTRQLLELSFWNPRDFTLDAHKTVDDRPYGGGPGMVMKVAPLQNAIKAAKSKLGNNTTVVYLSPQGKVLSQAILQQAITLQHLILIAGRYEGIDERLIESAVDEEWSIGDYVLSGGELPAMVVIDAMARLLPGALGDEESAQQDSFTTGLLDYPHYTRPEYIDGKGVPSVLTSGNHQAIARWRHQQALVRTLQRRPDLLAKRGLSVLEEQLLLEYFESERGK